MTLTINPRLHRSRSGFRQLAERLEMHRLRCGNQQSGPIFANTAGKLLALTSVVNRVILPALNRCKQCGKTELNHPSQEHKYERDARIRVARLARGSAWAGKQPVQAGSARYGDSAHPASREREHHGDELH